MSTIQILFSLLLTLGIYSACAGIDTKYAFTHRKKILSIVSIGVVGKACLTGLILYLAGAGVYSLILALIVTQIDPLSVAYVGNKKLSPDSKTLLNIWSNFDDPLTVLLLIYLAVPLVGDSIDLNISLIYVLNILLEVLQNK